MDWLKKNRLELAFWIVALTLLFFKSAEVHLFSLCPLALLGWEGWCPGCGIGRSINLLMHFQWTASFKAHWFGLPALIIIMNRIINLSKQ